jgi:hypothetical protein
MRVSPYVPVILTALIAMASAAQTKECLSSASAVWTAHPGSHATWRLRLPGHEGTKCWFARGSTDLPTTRVRQVADSPHGVVYEEADRRTEGPTIRASSQAKASAVDAPGHRLARSTSQDILMPIERRPLSILVWAGRPMHIDSTWEEVFAARERIGATFATEYRIERVNP